MSEAPLGGIDGGEVNGKGRNPLVVSSLTCLGPGPGCVDSWAPLGCGWSSSRGLRVAGLPPHPNMEASRPFVLVVEAPGTGGRCPSRTRRKLDGLSQPHMAVTWRHVSWSHACRDSRRRGVDPTFKGKGGPGFVVTFNNLLPRDASWETFRWGPGPSHAEGRRSSSG